MRKTWHCGRIARTTLALIAAALALAAGACGGADGDESPVDKIAEARRNQAARVARDAGLPDDVQRFLGQAAAGVRSSYTVVYRNVGAKKTTLLQRPPDRRIDVTDGATTESVIRNEDGTFACRREGENPWTCKRQAGPAVGPDPDLGVFSEDRIAETVRALSEAKSGYRFAVESRTVAGAKATCLVTTPTATPTTSAPDELCISKEGAVLRVRSASQSLEAESYRPKAEAAAMRLPATPG